MQELRYYVYSRDYQNKHGTFGCAWNIRLPIDQFSFTQKTHTLWRTWLCFELIHAASGISTIGLIKGRGRKAWFKCILKAVN